MEEKEKIPLRDRLWTWSEWKNILTESAIVTPIPAVLMILLFYFSLRDHSLVITLFGIISDSLVAFLAVFISVLYIKCMIHYIKK